MGRATKTQNGYFKSRSISIHALRGEGDGFVKEDKLIAFISIHALRGEGDNGDIALADIVTISIHALRGEGDQESIANLGQKFYFNPRPPWGGRRFEPVAFSSPPYFNPRPPWGGRPVVEYINRIRHIFQSTPSVGRATVHRLHGCHTHPYFNPRPPWGGRRA